MTDAELHPFAMASMIQHRIGPRKSATRSIVLSADEARAVAAHLECLGRNCPEGEIRLIVKQIQTLNTERTD